MIKKKTTGKTKKVILKVSHTRKPEKMQDKEWQTILRQQIAAEEIFDIKKTGDEAVFTDYHVFSEKTQNKYKVAIRSADNSLNFCSCPDFKTNQLGTCKHIEAVLNKIRKKPVLRRQLSIPFTPAYSSVYLDYRGERKVKLRLGTDATVSFLLITKKFFDKSNEIYPHAFGDFEKFLKKARSHTHEFRCYDDALEFILSERSKLQRDTLVKTKKSDLLKNISKAKLFPYQVKGVLFAVQAGRCILADEMGLGKTLQAIVSTEILRNEFGIKTAIIVCPTSLKYQWATEIKKFTGNSNICVVEGNILARKQLYENNNFDYMIVSYQMAANDAIFLNAMQADVLILDEAQRIKNWRTKTAAAMKKIKTNYAFVLTGTPVENKIEDLYSLMQIVNPYMLGSLHNFLSAHQLQDADTGKVIGYKNLNEIGSLLKNVMLRRTKAEVLTELPKRMDKVLFVPMTTEQSELHAEYADIVAKLVNKWKRMKFLNEQDRQMLLINLNRMRMVCDSTFIIDQETNFQTKLDEVQNILEEIIAMPEEKVVIFSQWERMTRLVAEILKEKKIKFEYLHGGIPGQKRGALYTNFNTDPECRVFLSTDAGGVGLNLQAAAYLINLDIPWNPAVLEQRIGRIYRLGQKKNVSITNLVSLGSIEHRMLDLLKFKTGVAAGILDGGENNIFLGDDQFKQFMKSVETVTSDIPVYQSDKAADADHKAETEMGTQPADTTQQMELAFEDSEKTTEIQGHDQTIEDSSAANKEDRVLENGVQFVEGLMSILSNPESTQSLVAKITETDKETGQVYLKLPISNTSVIENALKIFGSLFGGNM
jgi:SNF2 family DNA or RNA helicase